MAEDGPQLLVTTAMAAPRSSGGFGANNKIFTREQAEHARIKLRALLMQPVPWIAGRAQVFEDLDLAITESCRIRGVE